MRQATVNEVNTLHPFIQRANGTLHFRAHAFIDHTLLLQVIHL